VVTCSVVADIGDRLATIDMGRKLGAVPLWGGGLALSNTMSLGWRPTYQYTNFPSGILMH